MKTFYRLKRKYVNYNSIIWLLIVTVVIVLSAALLTRLNRGEAFTNVCIYDSIIFFIKAFGSITGIMVIWNIAVIKKDKNPMIAVKNVSRKKIWYRQCQDVLIFAAVMSLLIHVLLRLFILCKYGNDYNWDDSYSLYISYCNSNRYKITTPAFTKTGIAILSYIFTLESFYIILILFMVIDRLLERTSVIITVIYIIAQFEINLLGFITPKMYLFIYPDKALVYMGKCIFIAILLIFVGSFAADREEYIKKK